MLSTRLNNLNPYVPGEQPKDRVYIKLNANENPYPPCNQVSEDINSAVHSHPEKIGLYPDPDVNELRDAIADMINETGGCFASKDAKSKLEHKLTRDNIFCGNGSDEVLSFVFYTFFDKIIFPNFTYSFYPVYCGYYNIPMIQIPLKKDWTLDKDKMTETACRENAPIIFANPNAPTGIALKTSEIEEMIKNSPKDKVFVVDEAYADFSDESAIPLIEKYDNLVIVRTFSKSLSFAGMRCGFVISNPKLIEKIFTVKNSFNHFPIDFICKTAAVSSCKNYRYYSECAEKVCKTRKDFTEFLRSHGFFVIDSKTNFVFTRKDGISGKEIYEKVKNEGILIRHFATKGIEDFVRITIGTDEQMDKLKKILEKIQ